MIGASGRSVWNSLQHVFPQAEVHRIEDAGHYVIEDAHEKIIPWVRDFLQRNPVG